MAFRLKDLYSEEFYDRLGVFLKEVVPGYDHKQFCNKIFNEQWEALELKDRMAHTAEVLSSFLPNEFPKAVQYLVSLSGLLENSSLSSEALECMFLPAYIEKHGVDYFEESVQAMEKITTFTSCEFAVRPFYLSYPDQMMTQTMAWAKHPNFKVRRLASEGCRPRLPWAMGIPNLKKDPSPILPILELLKNDPEEWVRRSVANNLNDISKDHPEIARQLAINWKGNSKETDWVVKHGSRTLLKQGDPEIMELFGFSHPEKIQVLDFKSDQPTVKVGEDLWFEFNLENKGEHPALIRLEYAVFFLRSKGKQSKKVFQISEKEYPGNSFTTIRRKQHFKPISTRVYYPGTHKLTIIVNGIEKSSLEFEVVID